MPAADIDREIEELRDTLAGYQDDQTTGQLYELCRYLLEEIVERVSRIESKAGQLASFAGAILALLLSTDSTWRDQALHNVIVEAFVVLAVVSLIGAGWFAFHAMTATRFEWMSDRPIVFAKELLDYPDQLQRYHILAIYRTVLSHQEVSGRKALRVIASQRSFLFGAACLALGLLVTVIGPWAQGPLGRLYDVLPWRNL